MSVYSQVKKEELNVLSFIFPNFSQYLALNDFFQDSKVCEILDSITNCKVLNTDPEINNLFFLNGNVCVTRFNNNNGKMLTPEKVIQTVLPNEDLPLNMLLIYSWIAWQFRISVTGLSQSCIHHNTNKVFLLPDAFKGLTNNNDRLLVDNNSGIIKFNSGEINYLLEKDKNALNNLLAIEDYLKKLNKLFIDFKKTNHINIFDNSEAYGKPFYHNVNDYFKYKNKNEFFLNPFNKNTLIIEDYPKITKKIIDNFLEKKYSLLEVKEYLDFLNKQVPKSHDIFKDKNYHYMTFSSEYDRLLQLQKNIKYERTDYLKEIIEDSQDFFNDKETSKFLSMDYHSDEDSEMCNDSEIYNDSDYSSYESFIEYEELEDKNQNLKTSNSILKKKF